MTLKTYFLLKGLFIFCLTYVETENLFSVYSVLLNTGQLPSLTNGSRMSSWQNTMDTILNLCIQDVKEDHGIHYTWH